MNTSRAWVDVAIGGKNITADISGDVTSFSYTDNAADNADDISLTIQNRSGGWMGPWLPRTGDVIWARIVTEHWNGELDCRDFTIDDVSFSGWPLTVDIKALALPMNTDFSGVEKNRTWSGATMSEIARSVAGEVPLEYLAAYDPVIQFESQTQKSDKQYLHELCKKHGLTLKTYNNKVVVYDRMEREGAEASFTLTPADFTSFTCKTTISNTGYSACTVRYTNRDGVTLEHTAKAQDAKTDKLYRHDTVVDSLAEAQRVAQAKLYETNLEETAFSGSLPGRPQILSGLCFALSGFGAFDGKYFIDKTTHKVGGGYTTSLESHKIK